MRHTRSGLLALSPRRGRLATLVIVAILSLAVFPLQMMRGSENAHAATSETTTKTAYDSAGNKLAPGATVKPGDTITYAISDTTTDVVNQTAKRTLTDTMSPNLQYVQGSLTSMNPRGATGVTVTEPSTTNWSAGQQVATFDPTYKVAPVSQAGTNPTAQPVFGQNSQYVEGVSTPNVSTPATSNGDGFNPTFVKNSAGQLITWSITHHTDTEVIACQVVGSRQPCSSGQDFFGVNMATTQDENTLTIGTKGYMALYNNSNDFYIGCVDFANAAAGTAPVKCGAPVQILANVQGGTASHLASGVFLSGGKIYQIGTSLSSIPTTSGGTGNTDLILGCFDPATGTTCAGFSPAGNRIPVSETFNSGNVGGMLFRSEIWLPNGAFEFTTDSFGSATFCVKPSGTTLVNCDGTSPIKPVSTGNDDMSVPIVAAAGTGTVDAFTGTDTQVADAQRVTGWCTGNFGAVATECFDLNGVSIGMPYPGLQMQYTGNSRLHNGFAMPSGQAKVLYALDYGASQAACYDFAAKAPCASSPNDNTTRAGVTWLDQQTINGTLVSGKIYGARMIPSTPNCMVTLGDSSTFLYWRVDASGVVTPSPDGSGCVPLNVNFVNMQGRYCQPKVAGMTEWDKLVLSATTTGTSTAQPIGTNLVLDYYSYDPKTGAQGALLGTVTVPGSTTSTAPSTIAKPSWLNLATTPNFTIQVRNPQSGLTYQFTQYNQADASPAVCYQAKVLDSCTAGTTALPNSATWSNPAGTAVTATLTLNVVYDGKCVDVAKTAGSVTGPDANGVYTATFTVTATNSASIPATYGAITDTPGFTAGTSIQSASYSLNNGTFQALSSPYTLSTGGSLAANATNTYQVAIKFTLTSGASTQITQCAATPTSGAGLFNSVSMPNDKDTTNNTACDQPPGVPSFAVTKTLASNQTAAMQMTDNTWRVAYTITVTNTGTAAGTSAAVTDTPSVPAGFTVGSVTVDGATVAAPAPYQVSPGVALAAGATRSFAVVVSGTANLATADWGAAGTCNTSGNGDPTKGLFNTVAMTGDTDGASNNDACATVTPPNGSLTLLKRVASIVDVDGDGITGPGDTIKYAFDLTNTGPVTLAAVKVDDPMVGTVACPYQTLAAGQKETCTASYTITAADLDAGSVKNVATGSGLPPVGPEIKTPPSSTETPVYTKVHVRKLDTDGGLRTGATFALYATDPSTAGATPIAGGLTADTAGGATFTSTALTSGSTYWLVETKAPTGLQLMPHPIKFTVTSQGATIVGDSAAATVSSTGTFTIDVVDTPLPTLPSTGGEGVGMPLAGTVLVALTLIGAFRRRRTAA